MKKILLTLLGMMMLHTIHSQTVVPVDVVQASNNGFCTIKNTTIDIGSINDLFDSNASTLCRSANINPFECTLIFTAPVTFHSCSVLLAAGSNSWTLEVADSENELTGKWGSYQKLYSDRVTDDNQLDSVSLNSVSVKVIKLTAQRLTGDNYVHLFSWNLYAYSTQNAIMINQPFPDTTWVGATFKPIVTLSSIFSSTPFPLDSSKLSFSSSNTDIISIVNGIIVNPVAPGTASITANYEGLTAQRSLTVIADKFKNDLDVCYIKRLPEIPFVENSKDPGREGWPALGQEITWRAYSKNWSPDTLRNVAYQWLWNGELLHSGEIPFIPPYSYIPVDFDTTWSFDRKELTFVIDPANTYPELSERNNKLAIFTDALSIHFYVEDMTYRYFHDHQANLKVGTNSWEDWAQILQIQRWNHMFANAIYPETPNGVLDRVRLDSIYIVPNGALPLNGGLPTNHPDMNDKLCDLQWGFTTEGVTGTAYRNDTTATDANMFFYEGSLIHELGHARYLIDTYGLDLNDGYNHDKIKIMDNGQYIGGTDWMPFNAWDNVHYSLEHGLMSSNYTVVDRYSTMALNHIFQHRALCGNYNSPCNIGSYLNDIPNENRLTVIDQYGKIVPGATVSIYQAEPYSEWYGKTFDNTPELVFTTDAKGQTLLGHCPFSSTGSIIHGYGFSNAWQL
ncbi:MAG: hypothetical protein IPO21_00370 [Bacteroidales bacterium]|nr:hypothetical protein [Bacteroidales bacterium]